MCLAIPGRVVRVWDDGPAARMAEVDFDGVVKIANLVYTPEVGVGDYVIVHAGLATTRLPEAEALEAQRYAREMRELGEAAALVARPPGGPSTSLDPKAE
jgi:hydrogenase expression/formation protein HypC